MLFILNEDAILASEENYLFEDFLLISDPFRFLYGFLILIIATIGLILTHFIYLRETSKGKYPKDEKLQIKMAFMVILIVLTSIFNGFDYEESIGEEVAFIIMRGITTNGLPIYAFDLRTKSEIRGDNIIILTSGFLAALTSFSKELSSSKSQSTLTISSGNLYYIIFHTDNHIYSLQAGYYNKHLEAKFSQLSQDFEEFIASKDPSYQFSFKIYYF